MSETETTTPDLTAAEQFVITDAETAEEVAVGQIPLGGGAGIAIEMARQAAAEELARADEGVLRYGYDPARAWAEIADLNHRVVEAKRRVESDKKTASESKKDHDELVESLTARIEALEQQRRRPGLDLSGVEPGIVVGAEPCSYEAETGAPCPICHHGSPVAREEALDGLRQLLETRSAFLAVADLQTLDPTDLHALAEWARSPALVPPPLLAERAHVAGPVNAEKGDQCCSLCTTLLHGKVIPPDAEARADYYAEGVLVGLDCAASKGEA